MHICPDGGTKDTHAKYVAKFVYFTLQVLICIVCNIHSECAAR